MSSGIPDTVKFKFYMDKYYMLPQELKNDIIYCQRAMRDFLKVHALVSDVFKEQADADPVQMQRILDELEEEVYEINAEQQYLLLRLEDHMEGFYKKLHQNGILSVPELGNDYISSLIVPLIGDANYKIYPQSVLARDNEEMLIRKHFLVSQDEGDDGRPCSPFKLSELDENIPLMLVNDNENEDEQSHAEQLNILKEFGEATINQAVKGGCSSSVAVMIVPDSVLKVNRGEQLPPVQSESQVPSQIMPEQRSLLIPRGTSNEQQPAVAVAPSEIKPPPQLQVEPSKSPPPLAPIAVIKSQEVPTSDFESVAQSRMNLRQALKRARKTKQQPRTCDDEDALELTNVEGTRMMKLSEQHQLALAKSEIKEEAASDMKAEAKSKSGKEVPTVTLAGKKSSNSVASLKQHKTRNAIGARKSDSGGSPPPSSTSSSSSSSSSEDCNQELQMHQLEQQRLSSQWSDEPRETRVQPAEYGQEQFLGLFRLYTHDVVKKLNQRHSKRKRRTVQNNASGLDFHYGQQLAAMDAAARLKKQKAKPEFLLSPKEKRLQAKKAHKAGNSGSRKSKSPDKVEDLPQCSSQANSKAVIPPDAKPKCSVCKKRTDFLLNCQHCPAHYHLDCHVAKPHPNKCPQCLREQVTKSCTEQVRMLFL